MWGIQKQWVLLKIRKAPEAIKLEKPVKVIYMKVTYPLLTWKAATCIKT